MAELSQTMQAQHILSEKNDLERALFTVQEALQTSTQEKDQLTRLFNDFKQHFETVQVQSTTYQKRLVEEMQARKNIEDQFEQRLNQMTGVIERKQGELDSLAQKMQLPVDMDILRMRMQKDIESKFRFELESRTQELERTTDSLYEAKRQLELLKSSHETQRKDNDKLNADLRRRHKEEVDSIADQNHQLQLQIDDQRDQETVRKLKRDLDEQKRRNADQQVEVTELRRERDVAKLERNDLLVKHAKEMEGERSVRRGMQGELEKLKYKVKSLEDEVQRAVLRAERKAQEAQAEVKDKCSIMMTVKEKDLVIDSQKRQINQLKEDVHQRDQENESLQRRVSVEERSQSEIGRQNHSRIQKQMDTLERNYAELEAQRKRDLGNLQDQLNQVEQQNIRLQKERDEALRQVQQVSLTHSDLEKANKDKNSQFESLQKDFLKSQERLRQAMSQETALASQKQALETQQKMRESEKDQIQDSLQKRDKVWQEERAELQQKIQDLLAYTEKTREECMQKVVAYKEKHSEYKKKVVEANKQIQSLTQRLAKYETYIQQQQQFEQGESDQ